MKHISLLLIFIVSLLCTYAQKPLSLEEAILFSVVSNYNVRIAKKNVTQAELANNSAMAGALPHVNITGNAIVSDFIDDNRDLLFQNSLNADITVFNGFKIIATKEQLQLLQNQSKIALKIQIQNTIAAVIELYYEVLRQQSYIEILQASLAVAQERLAIVTKRQQVGLANDSDVLQAQIDVIAIEQQISQQRTLIAQTKFELLYTMNKTEETDIVLTDSITVGKLPPYDEIITKINTIPQILYSQIATEIAKTSARQIESQRYPSAKLVSNYTLQNNTKSNSVVPMVGITYTIPLYSGGTVKTQMAIAQNSIAIKELEQAQAQSQILYHINKTYVLYEQTLQQLHKQIDAYEYSKQLLHLVMKRFEANLATTLEVKAAQLSFEQAGYLLTNQRFTTKMAEVEILRTLCEIAL